MKAMIFDFGFNILGPEGRALRISKIEAICSKENETICQLVSDEIKRSFKMKR